RVPTAAEGEAPDGAQVTNQCPAQASWGDWEGPPSGPRAVREAGSLPLERPGDWREPGRCRTGREAPEVPVLRATPAPVPWAAAKVVRVRWVPPWVEPGSP